MAASPLHSPVLYTETLASVFRGLRAHTPNIVIDMTLGLGGHASGVIEKLGKNDTFIGFDADTENLLLAQAHIQKQAPKCKTLFIHRNFSEVKEELDARGVAEVSAVYWDLGVSSAHFDIGDRGFSFRFDGPLDMRFDRSSPNTLTAEKILAEYDKEHLVRIFSEYGEERFSKTLADALIRARPKKNISAFTTTAQLAQFIDSFTHDPKSKVRVFQALRMEVNNELGVIQKSIHDIFPVIRKGGTLSVITFHSVEDRCVKHIFADLTSAPVDPITGHFLHAPAAEKLTKKPQEPSQEEIQTNYRARSAKLRSIIKT